MENVKQICFILMFPMCAWVLAANILILYPHVLFSRHTHLVNTIQARGELGLKLREQKQSSQWQHHFHISLAHPPHTPALAWPGLVTQATHSSVAIDPLAESVRPCMKRSRAASLSRVMSLAWDGK